MKDTVLILRPPLAMATVSRSTENTAIEKWPPLTQIQYPWWKLQETQRPLFSCDRDMREVLKRDQAEKPWRGPILTQ